MVSKDEAIHKALKVLNCLNNDRVYETAWVKGAINACEEALEQPEIGDAEIKQMLNDIEYYQKRIEALEQPAFGECGNKSCGGHGACYCEEQPVMAISQMNNDALKNALNNQGKLSVSSPQPQPAQEPVAWMLMGIEDQKPKLLTLQIIDNVEGTWTPLYTHPHQWQGLTDDEIRHCLYDLDTQDFLQFARAIEAKLKEKNYD